MGEIGNAHYCHICGRDLYPENEAEVESGEHDFFIYVHDEVPHDDDFYEWSNGLEW